MSKDKQASSKHRGRMSPPTASLTLGVLYVTRETNAKTLTLTGRWFDEVRWRRASPRPRWHRRRLWEYGVAITRNLSL